MVDRSVYLIRMDIDKLDGNIGYELFKLYLLGIIVLYVEIRIK